MKVQLLQENLAAGVKAVKSALPKRLSTLPQLGHVLVATEKGYVKLTATDLELAITSWVGALVEEEGAITIPGKWFIDFVNSQPKERIDIVVESKKVCLTCESNRTTVVGGHAQDFPPIPTVPGRLYLLDGQAFRQAIAQVEFAAATDDTRPVLTGIHTLLEDAELTLAAANGFCLAVRKLPAPPGDRIEVIIPARAMRELSRIIGKRDDPIGMAVDKDRVLFTVSNTELVAQLIQGTFPNYSQLIPQSYTCRAVVYRDTFLRAVLAASVLARSGSDIVRLEMEANHLSISARDEENECREELDASIEGTGRIAFNWQYLRDVLRVLDCEQVALETTDFLGSPGVIRAIGVEDYIYVVMPLFVQWENTDKVSD